MCVLHRCDNGICVKPSHLFVGTQKDNVKDMYSKGRFYSKVSADDVNRIRRLVSSGVARKDLAISYGIVVSTIGRIVNNITWRHL